MYIKPYYKIMRALRKRSECDIYYVLFSKSKLGESSGLRGSLFQHHAAGHDSSELCIVHDIGTGVSSEFLFHQLLAAKQVRVAASMITSMSLFVRHWIMCGIFILKYQSIFWICLLWMGSWVSTGGVAFVIDPNIWNKNADYTDPQSFVETVFCCFLFCFLGG